MIMHLTFEFNYNGRVYFGRNIDIGDTIDIESEKKDIEGLKISAICHAFDLTVGYDDEKIEQIKSEATFKYCELEG